MQNKNISYPSVTVILLNYNGINDTRLCLKSLQKTNYSNYKIIVADNGSENDELSLISSEFKDKKIKYIQLKKNYGFTGGNNIAAEYAKTKYIVLLNNDTKVTPNWLKELVKVAESDANIMVCQSKLKSMSNPEYFDYAGASGGFIDKYGYPFTRGRMFETIEKDLGQYDDQREIFWACGAAMLIRRSVFEKVDGLFDNEFFIYMEEVDFCWRVWNAGFKIVIAPKSVVYHRVAASQQRNLSKKRSREHRNNLILLYKNLSKGDTRRVFFGRFFFELITYVFYFIKGQFSFVGALGAAHINFLKGLKKYKKTVSQYDIQSLISRGIVYNSSIVTQHFMFGKKMFSKLDMKKEVNSESKISIKWHMVAAYALVAFFIVSIWFFDKKPISVGEESFTIFNNISISNQVSYWQEGGAGYLAPHFATRIVPVLFYRALSIFGLPIYISQGIMMGSILFLGMLGTCLLANHLLKNRVAAFCAGVFYLFNIFAMSQIWSRFLYSGMFLWALLPISLFIWINWLESGHKKYLIAFGITHLLFSNALLQPAHIPTVLIPLVIFALFQIYVELKSASGNVKNIIGRIAGAGIVWIGVNVWWLYPYFRLSSEAFSEIAGFKSNFDSLVGVSKYFPVSEILLLRQRFLLSANSNWSSFFAGSWSVVLSLVILLLTITGWVNSKRNKYWPFITLLSLVALFVVKGSNPPFGSLFFRTIFKYLPFTMALRNPYEKFGLTWLLPYSILFGWGLQYISSKSHWLRSVVWIGGLLIAAGVVWPLWRGVIYYHKKAAFPDYYYAANLWLNQQTDDSRIFQAPSTPGDSMVYKWGYGGIEPSEFIFDRSSISKINRFINYDSKYKEVVSDFNKNTHVLNDMSDFNVGYIVVHRDIDPSVKWGNSKLAESTVKSNNGIRLVKTFGELDIYKLPEAPGLFTISGGKDGKLQYRKIDNRHYILNLKNMSDNSNLVFRTTYSKFWEARVDNKVIPGHNIAMGYANSWKVTKSGDYTINVVFKIWPWE